MNNDETGEQKIQVLKRKKVKKSQSEEQNSISSSQNTQQLNSKQEINPIEYRLQEEKYQSHKTIKHSKSQEGPQQIIKNNKTKYSQQINHNNYENQIQNQQTKSKPKQTDQTHNKISNLQSPQKSLIQPQKLPHQKLNYHTVHILAVSDNHGDYKIMNQILQLKGDIFIHAGDFTYQGKDEDFEKFFIFLDNLKFRHKIVISGNHQNVLSKLKLKTITKLSRQKIISQLKKRCTYLQHEFIQIEGIKIFASPYTPQYCQKPTSRAFQYKYSQENIIWSNIPEDIDLLITHGPPYGILDSGKNGKRGGSEALKQAVQKIKPKYHIFGHIHESKGGMTKIQDTTYINLCNTPTRFLIKK